jgi:hypothetical protein
VVAAQIGGRMLDSIGAKTPMLLGCLVGAIGYALWGWKLTALSESSQAPYIILSGAGIGFLLGPASTDGVNRAINASYGEVTGITQTLRNYGSSLGLAILGTLLLNVNTNKITNSLRGFGVPPAQAANIAHDMSQSSGAGSQNRAGLSALPPQQQQQVIAAIRLDYAEATQFVFYGMTIALLIAFVCAVLHPGGRVTREREDARTTGPGRRPAA